MYVVTCAAKRSSCWWGVFFAKYSSSSSRETAPPPSASTYVQRLGGQSLPATGQLWSFYYRTVLGGQSLSITGQLPITGLSTEYILFHLCHESAPSGNHSMATRSAKCQMAKRARSGIAGYIASFPLGRKI